MRTHTVFVLSAVLACGAAFAQQRLTTVEVRADSRESVEVSCASPSISMDDVGRVLAVKDPARTSALRKKMISAASEACKAGIPRILVSRGVNAGSLTWKQMD